MIGTGHLMRCLTLASALREEGATCIFICRAHSTSLTGLVRKQGFTLHELPQAIEPLTSDCLGVAKLQDAEETKNVIQGLPDVPDWLIVDHYGIDEEWERELRPFVKRIFVIDDLANRPHDCDVLLDQNVINNQQMYKLLVPKYCYLFVGSDSVILRPEFIQYRSKIQKRRLCVERLLIYFGGADICGLTSMTLEALLETRLLDTEIDIVIGKLSCEYEKVIKICEKYSSNKVRLYEDLPHLAELMVEADLSIGTGGITTWERIYLSLPSLVISSSENQIPILLKLDELGLICYVGHAFNYNKRLLSQEINAFLNQASPDKLNAMHMRMQEYSQNWDMNRLRGFLLQPRS
jgi:UDP-2,4-diacetamido-2,4,6-trideoxy-beta-L-altropyranose hydrolase